ncbi:hypothetical protein PGT21_035896 [Puccinia graminis f. sp. tritici]|uniref:Uncharacterized protein n=1 Tax=Puccinia graminis f. sp. tritici TaxID=56615 RepID=A0A5B0Q0L3_PUCGR|nr:hypothetical protein PGT21_035896 [Puccinia graminis f. sp. tritici]KAA1126277.1 hypothetical protein PGTUg99_023324 [Puccinia graminis f. sp. tritici]
MHISMKYLCILLQVLCFTQVAHAMNQPLKGGAEASISQMKPDIQSARIKTEYGYNPMASQINVKSTAHVAQGTLKYQPLEIYLGK